MEINIKTIVDICDGTLYSGNPDLMISNFTKDTREIKEYDTYIGIKGNKFDGNKYYIDAFNKGAICAILEKESFEELEGIDKNMNIILVDNSIMAIGEIASYIRNSLDIPFIGVTGSVGKTSTRDMVSSVMNTTFKTLKTEGNFNNDIGLPLTIMKYNNEESAVIEMGMNHLKEISYLSKITKPNIGIITNVGSSHIGNLGSRENILKAKLEIKDGMDDGASLIINNDNDLLHEYYLENSKNIITIGINNNSDFMARNIVLDENSSLFDIHYKDNVYEVYCPIPGEAFVYNSLIAFAVGTLLNIEPNKIIAGIRDFVLTKNRIEINTINGVKIINGIYNASLDSMKDNIEVLSQQNNKRKIAVLGSMLELGSYSEEFHRKVGGYVYEYDIDILITVGEDAKFIAETCLDFGMNKENIKSFDNNIDASNYLKNIIKKDDVILLKASNGLNFKEILEELKNYLLIF